MAASESSAPSKNTSAKREIGLTMLSEITITEALRSDARSTIDAVSRA